MNSSYPSHQRRILLVVPRVVRDLEGHALVAYYLRERFGHEVKLYTGPDTEQVFLDYKADAVVLDYLGWEDRAREARLAKSVNAKVFVLPTAGVFPDEDGFLRGAGEPTGACKLVDCYMSWGEYAANSLRSRRLIPEDRIQLTGCPRFDFYVNTNLGLVEDRADFLTRLGISNPQAPLILWCTTTNDYNNLDKDPERFVTGMMKGASCSEQQLRIEIQDQREQMSAHSEALRTLASRHKEWNFIIKVHPLEHRQFYKNLAHGSNNLFLAPNIPIRQFLFHSDVLLQRGCTTATEAWVLKKPVLELEIGTFQSQSASPEHTVGNHSVHNTDEAERAILYYLNGGKIGAEEERARQAYLRKFYFRVDGLASLRCATRIDREVSSPGYSDEHHANTLQLIEEARIRAGANRDMRVVAQAKRLLGIEPRRTLRPWKRTFWTGPPRIDPHELEHLYHQYRCADKQAANCDASLEALQST